MSGGRCNLAAVRRQMTTGGGPAPPTESMAVLGIPSLTKRCFIYIKKRIGEWWWALLEESVKEANPQRKPLLSTYVSSQF